MLNKRTALLSLIAIAFLSYPLFAEALTDNWNDFLHYIKIGRFDLAKANGNALLAENPTPQQLLALSEDNPLGYQLLVKVKDTSSDPELTQLTGKILDLIEQGKFLLRSDPKTIIEEVKRLNSTDRGYLTAVKHLQNSGEYAVVYMIDAMGDPARTAELPNIIRALPQIGKDAIRPLAAALQTKNRSVRAEIIKALGQIKYPQSLPYLKFAVEKEDTAEMRDLAVKSITEIDPAAINTPAAQLFYELAEKYYYHNQSLMPAQDTNAANIWFWNAEKEQLYREAVAQEYFNELMSMRCCEWSLRADANSGQSIALWLDSYFKAESTNIKMPEYFGQGHSPASVYATTSGPEYLHQALARAIKDKNAYVALGLIEALAVNAGEKSLFMHFGPEQPVMEALTFDNKSVRYSAAIAVAIACPQQNFPESKFVTQNLADALDQNSTNAPDANDKLWTEKSADLYAMRSVTAMLNLAVTHNKAVNLAGAQSALISAAKDKRTALRIVAAQVLAYLESPDAQRAICATALDAESPAEVKIAAFNSLTQSAKVNGNLLPNETVDAIYDLVKSTQTEPQLRSAAAGAYGALNLPSHMVKNLILDQAKI